MLTKLDNISQNCSTDNSSAADEKEIHSAPWWRYGKLTNLNMPTYGCRHLLRLSEHTTDTSAVV